MKKSAKVLSMALAAAMMLSLTACSGGADGTASTEAAGAAEEKSDAPAGTDGAENKESEDKKDNAGTEETYTVGICQLVQHDALDAATLGFKDALTEALGDKVKFDEQNAQGDSNTCSTIINSFVSSDVDLILANATPALQAAQAGTNEIPVLGTSVTEYGVALGIDGFTGTVGGNISGTSDLAPLDEQAAMLHELFPDST